MEDELKASEIVYQYLDGDTREEYFFTTEEMERLDAEVERIKKEVKQYEVKRYGKKRRKTL